MFDCESFETNLVGHSYLSFMSAQAVRVFVDPGHATSYIDYIVMESNCKVKDVSLPTVW